MIGSPERVKIQKVPYQKLGKFIAAFRSYRSKTLKTVNLIFVLNDQNFATSEFSRHIEYYFLKEHHKNNFQSKNYVYS